MLRPKRRSKSEPEAEDFRRAEAQDLRATVQELRTKPKATKPTGQDLTAKAEYRRAKEARDPRAKVQDPRATVQELRTKAKAPKPKGQDLTAKAQDPELKPKTAKLK